MVNIPKFWGRPNIDEQILENSMNVEVPLIRKINQLLQKYKKKNPYDEVYNLWIWQITFKTDEKIIKAWIKALEEENIFWYWPAEWIKELREGIAKKQTEKDWKEYSFEDVIVTLWVQWAMQLAIYTLKQNWAKRILIPEINFWIYHKIPKAYGIEVVTYKLTDDYGIDLKDLKNKIKKDDLVILNFPSNPTWRILYDEEAKELWKLLNEKLTEWFVISDEIYDELVYEPWKTTTSISKYFNRVAIVNGFSKSWGMAGVRVGYLIMPPWLFEDVQEEVKNFFKDKFQKIASTSRRYMLKWEKIKTTFKKIFKLESTVNQIKLELLKEIEEQNLNNEKQIEEFVTEKLKSMSHALIKVITANARTQYSCPPTISQKMALPVIKGETTATIQEYRETFLKNREYVISVFDRLGIEYTKPEWGFYIFPRIIDKIPQNYTNVIEFCKYLAENKGIAVIPWETFWKDKRAKESIRISLAVEPKQFKKSIDKLIQNLNIEDFGAPNEEEKNMINSWPEDFGAPNEEEKNMINSWPEDFRKKIKWKLFFQEDKVFIVDENGDNIIIDKNQNTQIAKSWNNKPENKEHLCYLDMEYIIKIFDLKKPRNITYFKEIFKLQNGRYWLETQPGAWSTENRYTMLITDNNISLEQYNNNNKSEEQFFDTSEKYFHFYKEK